MALTNIGPRAAPAVGALIAVLSDDDEMVRNQAAYGLSQIGAAAVPSPIADIAWDGWLWHHLTTPVLGFSTTETGQSPMEAERIVIDSKAMRKIKDTDVLMGIFEIGTETGTATMRVAALTRVLDKIA